MTAKAKLQPKEQQPTPLAVPTLPANTPVIVPHDKPAPTAQETAVTLYASAAHDCAEGILSATRTRFESWLHYAAKVQSVSDIPSAATVLQQELARMGFKRAQVEASEWKLCAIAYFTDREMTANILDADRKVPLRDNKGEPVKDAAGAVKLVRPPMAEVLDSLREVRDAGSKSGAIPKDVYEPRAVKSSKTAQKLTGVQLESVFKNIQVADDSQINSIFLRIIDRAKGNALTLAGWEGVVKEMRIKAEQASPPPKL